MFQNNRWTDTAVKGVLIHPYSTPQLNPHSTQDLGPIAVGDTSQGTSARVWTATLDKSGQVVLEDYGVLFTRQGLYRICLTFDTNGRPSVAFEDKDGVWVWWYDTLISANTFAYIGQGNTPFIRLDERRADFSAIADMVLVYFRDGKLFFRLQRDRFLTEYTTQFENIFPTTVLNFGLADNQRLQLEYEDRALNYIQTYVKVLTEEVDKLQEDFLDLLNNRGISTAIAAQLDLIGKIVGLPRLGRGDDVYREALYFKALLNNTEGTPNETLTALKTITKADTVAIWEHYPALVVLSSDGDVSASLVDEVKSLIPAGVAGPYIAHDSLKSCLKPAEYPTTEVGVLSHYLPEYDEVGVVDEATAGLLAELYQK